MQKHRKTKRMQNKSANSLLTRQIRRNKLKQSFAMFNTQSIINQPTNKGNLNYEHF